MAGAFSVLAVIFSYVATYTKMKHPFANALIKD